MTDLSGRRMALAVDATPAVGAGHAMRVGTLAAAWLGLGGEVVAVGDVDLEFVRTRYAGLGIGLAPVGNPVCDVLVVDRYDVGQRSRMATSPGAVVRLLVDDLFAKVPAGYDAVWNPNPYASAESYPTFDGLVLGGATMVPIREDLPPWQQRLDGNVVVTFGGGRPSDVVIGAVGLLIQLMPRDRFAVAGDWAPAGCRRVEPEHLWREAAAAKCLVSAAGGTLWEAAATGIPMVAVAIVENQMHAYRWARNVGIPGANAMLIDGESLAHQLRALIPAAMIAPALTNGAGRVATELARLVLGRSS